MNIEEQFMMSRMNSTGISYLCFLFYTDHVEVI